MHNPIADPDEAVPLSYAQQALWFYYLLAPGCSVYNMGVALQFDNALDLGRIGAALNAVARRHRILSSVFHDPGDDVGQRPVGQRQQANTDISLSLVSLSAPLDTDSMKRAVQAYIAEPFDLRTQKPLRAALLRAPGGDILVLTLHHLVADAGSIEIVLRELALVYSNGDAALVVPPRQYAEYASRECSSEHLSQLADARKHWLSLLRSAPRVFELPTQNRRPSIRDYSGATLSEVLPDTSTQQLRRLAHERRLTPAAVLLAAYQCQLHRYTGQSDFLIGMPVSTRTTEDSEAIVGLFVNTVAIRSRVQGSDTFVDLMDRARSALLGAMDHQHYPFSLLVNDLNVARDLSREPLVQVSFNYVRATQQVWQFGAMTGAPLDLETSFAKNDFSFQFIDSGDSLRCIVVYDSRLFERWFVEAWYRNFLVLLSGVVAVPEARISELPLLPQAELDLTLRAWNDTQAEFPRDQCVHTLFEQQVAVRPDAIALRYADQQLSYAELNDRADKLADRLRSQGVIPETLVAVCMPRSLDMLVSLLAILKAGGAYLALDPEQPAVRMAQMLQDAAPLLMLTQKQSPHLRSDFRNTRVRLEDCQAPDPQLTEHSAQAPQPNHLAYCLYTSGSTGMPKGVAVSHQAIVARLSWMQATYHLGPGDRVMQKTSLGFDVSVWEFFWTLSTGACLCIPSDDEVRDIDRLIGRLIAEQITFAHFTPSVLSLVLANDDFLKYNVLRFLVSGGETLPVALLETAMRVMAGRFHNRYGPTEAAINATCWIDAPADTDTTSIGRPIANTQIYILDEHLNPVPIGVTGQIHIAGVGLARGYLGRADLTAEKFVPDPFGEPGSRMYRSGDLGRYRPDGNIEFLGRIDNQLKMRGYRIEPGEIESALRHCVGVRDAVVVARDETVDRHLVAYIVAQEIATPPSADALREELRQRLPDYMMPAAYVFLPALPLNANGKLDRTALPAADTLRARSATAYAAPRNAMEALLADIWKDVLVLDRVGIHDNFFALGGHSLMATRLVSRLRIVASRPVHVRDVFLSPTVAELALRLGGDEQTPARPAIVPRLRPTRAAVVFEN